MKNTNFIKRATIDVVFALLLFTSYKKNIISMTYHEVVGLIILVVLLIHLIFNRQWIVNQTKSLFSKNVSKKNKILFIDDICLLLDFVIIIISGILISKELFHFDGFMWVKKWHYFFSMISLILLGIHFGLHDKFISLIFGNFEFLGKHKNQILCTLLIVISIFGIVMLFFGDFARYILMPFIPKEIMEQAGHGAGQGMRNGMGKEMATGGFLVLKVFFMGLQSFSIITLFATITKFASQKIESKSN